MTIKHKTTACLLTVVFCAMAFSGCIQSDQQIIVDEEGMAQINFSAIADKSQAGSELDQLAWQVEQLIPELNTNYESRNYTFEEDYTEYLVYEWRAKNKVPVTDIRGVTWNANNGSYEFQLDLERVFDPESLDESERNEVVMELSLTMPKDISMANTPTLEGNTVKWLITKELLSQNTTMLWAVAE